MASKAKYFISAGLLLFVLVSVSWGIWMWSDNKHLKDPNRFEKLYRKGFRVEHIRGDGAAIMTKRLKDGRVKRIVVRNTSTVDPALLTPTATTASQPSATPASGTPVVAPKGTKTKVTITNPKSAKYHFVPVKDQSGHIDCVKVKTKTKISHRIDRPQRYNFEKSSQSKPKIEHNVIIVHKDGKKVKCVPKTQVSTSKKVSKCKSKVHKTVHKPVICHQVRKEKTYHHPSGCKVKVYKHTYHDLHGNLNHVHVHSKKQKKAHCNVYHVWVKKHRIHPNVSYQAVKMHKGKLGVHIPGHISKQNMHFFEGVEGVKFVGIRKHHGKQYRCWKNVKQEVAFDPKYYAPHRHVLIEVPKDKNGRKMPITNKTRVTFCVRVTSK